MATPPDSALATEATQAARDLLSPVDVSAMIHDTGLATPVDGVDFTSRSAEIARAFTGDRVGRSRQHR